MFGSTDSIGFWSGLVILLNGRMDRMTNKEVLEQIRENRTLWINMKKKWVQKIGHTLRQDRLLTDILVS